MRQVLGMFLQAFPDMHVELHHVLADGDLVCSHGTFTGTHEGEFMGVGASGKAVTVDYIDLWRVDDGKGVENWVRLDMLGLLQQIGAVPPSAPG
jgi:predicted ester cyclase